MITLFTAPKPFHDHIATIQRNAIRSWLQLRPACEIILLGDDEGANDVARKFGLRHIPDVARNEYGTPLLSSLFELAQAAASYPLLAYVNADIILLSDFIEAVHRTRFRRFLMVGQRWNIDLTELWDFEHPDWEVRLRRYVVDHGVLHSPSGIDYFVFPRDGVIEKLPPFAVGRPGWDNWFIYKARDLGIPVVDVTRVATVIHQSHDYSHVPKQRREAWEGPEADWNRELMGGQDHVFTTLDATHVMTPKALLPALGVKHLRRRWQTLPILVPATRSFVRIVNRARHRLAVTVDLLGVNGWPEKPR